MTDATINALIIAVPTTIAALSGLIVSIRNGVKADTIAKHVNSTASAAVTKIESLQREVQELRTTLAENKQIAAVLAQTAAGPHVQPVEVVNAPSAPVPPTPV